MATKAKATYDRHNMIIAGVASDFYDESGIDIELKKLVQKYEEDEVNPKRIKIDDLKLAKHYITFFVQSWSFGNVPTKFCVARYSVATVDSAWLLKVQEEIICELARYGFIVDSISSDGASENRTMNKTIANITALEFFKEDKNFLTYFCVSL